MVGKDGILNTFLYIKFNNMGILNIYNVQSRGNINIKFNNIWLLITMVHTNKS